MILMVIWKKEVVYFQTDLFPWAASLYAGAFTATVQGQ